MQVEQLLTLTVEGMRYGRLVTVRREPATKRAKDLWHCRCDCGGEKSVRAVSLRRGATVSCGCVRSACVSQLMRRHGFGGRGEHRIYRIWSAMKSRCYNPRTINYKYYGARGISVCARWRDSFEAFLADMGQPPTPTHSIDRIHNDRGYEPANCRWATAAEQNANRRTKPIRRMNA